MTKARVSYVFHAGILDADRNEAVDDSLARGLCICSTSGSMDYGFIDVHTLTIWPYSSSKSVWDALRIVGRMRTSGAQDHDLEFTPNTGATWQVIAPAGTLPYAFDPPEPGLVSRVNAWDWNVDLDLTGISGSQWIGLRFRENTALSGGYSWALNAYLTCTSRTPY